MNDNNENKTDNNNEDELFIVYKKNTLSSHYLMKLMDGPGTHIRKSLVEGDIVIDSLGEYLMMYQMNTDISRICKLLSLEIGNDDNEPKPLQNKEKNERPYKMTF